jgi:hypothetical protein
MSDCTSPVPEELSAEEATPSVGKKMLRRFTDALSAEQQRALAMLTDGQPIRAAADTVGVNRGTIYRWIQSDPQFRAAYNAWQLEQRESCRAMLLRAAERAVGRIIDCIDIDRGLAFKVAKELGLFDHPQKLSTEPERVDQQMQIEALEEENRLDRRQLKLLLAKASPPPKQTHPQLESESDSSAGSSDETASKEAMSRMVNLDKILSSIEQT